MKHDSSPDKSCPELSLLIVLNAVNRIPKTRKKARLKNQYIIGPPIVFPCMVFHFILIISPGHSRDAYIVCQLRETSRFGLSNRQVFAYDKRDKIGGFTYFFIFFYNGYINK